MTVDGRHWSMERLVEILALSSFLPDFWSLLLNPRHIQHAAVIVQRSRLFRFHGILMKRTYRQLFSANHPGRPRPKGPSRRLFYQHAARKHRVLRRQTQTLTAGFGASICG